MTSSATERLDTSQTDPGRPGRIAALDGLRGIAVVAVLLFHTAGAPLAGGYLGVDVFFVLSGFLIAGILLDSWDRGHGLELKTFWLRRARRLAPPLLVLLLALSLARVAVPQIAVDLWRADILAALTYTTNWFLIFTGAAYFDEFGVASPLMHTWSLAIEEQFYLGFAVVLLLLVPRLPRGQVGLVLAVATIGSAAWMAIASAWDESWAYFSTGTRIQALLVGALLALWVRRSDGRWWSPNQSRRRDVLGWMAAAGLAVCLVIPDGQALMFRGGFLLVAFFVAGIIWSALAPGRMASVLSWRPLVAVGVISYGIYLWHWPLFLMLGTNDPATGITRQVWAFLLTGAAAAASYVLVERPVRQGRFTRLSQSRQWLAYAGTTVVIVGLAMLPARTPAADIDLPWPDAASVPGSVMVAGDSTMLRLWDQFPSDRYPQATVGGPARLGCGFVGIPSVYGSQIRSQDECAGWQQTWQQEVAARNPDVAVVGSVVWDVFDRYIDGEAKGPGTPEFDTAFLAGYREAVLIAGDNGRIPVYLVGQPCMATSTSGDVLNDNDRTGALDVLIQASVQGMSNAHFVDIRPLTCDANNTTITSRNGRMLRDDGVHWIQAGSDEVWSKVLSQVAADRESVSP
jgi:peptidoglycan/LPS O-acetylase OafA/YrhL